MGNKGISSNHGLASCDKKQTMCKAVMYDSRHNCTADDGPHPFGYCIVPIGMYNDSGPSKGEG
jgi:hypothetical protein